MRVLSILLKAKLVGSRLKMPKWDKEVVICPSC